MTETTDWKKDLLIHWCGTLLAGYKTLHEELERIPDDLLQKIEEVKSVRLNWSTDVSATKSAALSWMDHTSEEIRGIFKSHHQKIESDETAYYKRLQNIKASFTETDSALSFPWLAFLSADVIFRIHKVQSLASEIDYTGISDAAEPFAFQDIFEWVSDCMSVSAHMS